MIATEQEYQYPAIWSFVTQPTSLPTAGPFSLAEGVVLRKAHPKERDLIKRALRGCVGRAFGLDPAFAYEHDIGPGESETALETQRPLAADEYRYHVVTKANMSIQFVDINLASNATESPLSTGFLTFHNETLMGWSPKYQTRFFELGKPPVCISPSIFDLEEIRSVLAGFLTHKTSTDPQFPEVRRAFSMYDALNYLPIDSEFEFIGLFAIIEMLVTHNPKLEDRGDSITHQMQSKVPLLMRRFTRQVQLSDFFSSEVKDQKIWQALYKCRSAVAHGGEVDFANALQVLKSQEVAKGFLAAVVRGLLRQVLLEPQLFADLRQC